MSRINKPRTAVIVAITAAITVALFTIAAAIAYGISSASGSDVRVTSAPPVPAASASVAEDAFYRNVSSWTDLELKVDRAFLVDAGHDICREIGKPRLSRDDLITKIRQANYTITETAAMLVAAEQNLCPGKVYVQTAPIIPTASVPTT